MDPDNKLATSYEVLTVNLKSGEIGEAEDAIFGVQLSAAAASLNRIAVCGGRKCGEPQRQCQIYSPATNMYVYYFERKP